MIDSMGRFTRRTSDGVVELDRMGNVIRKVGEGSGMTNIALQQLDGSFAFITVGGSLLDATMQSANAAIIDTSARISVLHESFNVLDDSLHLIDTSINATGESIVRLSTVMSMAIAAAYGAPSKPGADTMASGFGLPAGYQKLLVPGMGDVTVPLGTAIADVLSGKVKPLASTGGVKPGGQTSTYSGQPDAYQSGGFIPRTGSYLLHAGEYVSPRGGRGGEPTSGGSAGANIKIDFSGSFAEDLKRDLRKFMEDYMRDQIVRRYS